MHGGAIYAIPAICVLALALARAIRSERRALYLTTLLFLFASSGLLLAWLAEKQGLKPLGEFLRGLSIFGQGMCIIYLIGVLVFHLALPALRLASPPILQDIIVAVAYLIWGLLWLGHNVNLASIIATSTVISAVIGFALQDTLGNILGGMAIEIEGSVKVGDWIAASDVVGRVVEIRWRHTSLETRNWETVVIPNSVLAKDKFTVLGQRRGQPLQLRRWIWFNVDFRYSPAHVVETAERAIRAAEIPNVACQPLPNCVFMEYAESYGRYALRYWLTSLPDDDPTDSQVRAHLFAALHRAGISPSMPAQAVFLTEETAERKALKSQETITHQAEALGKVELFHQLQPRERSHLAERLLSAPFEPGDVITRQGEDAHWLYILTRGQADVVVQGHDGHTAHVATLGPGDVFGEMGLMTGENRRATVIARTAVECYRLDKTSFQGIIEDRPEIVEEIAPLIARRRMELDAALENLDQEAQAQRFSHAREDTLLKIRRFFALVD